MADDEQFSLCWNNFNSNLSAGFHESLCRGDLVDVTLAAEGQFVKAHRLVLSVCSPYFRKMFTQMPPNQHAFVFLKDVSHSALKDLIQFMYCGEVNVKQDALPAFISTAEALQIKGLTDSDPAPSQSPAKPSTPAPQPAPPAQSLTSPRVRQRSSTSRSYRIETDDSDDKTTQIVLQATTAVQQQTQPTIVQQTNSTATVVTQKRAAPRSISTPHTKRVKNSADPLEASEPTQIAVQTITESKSSSEPEFIELPIEIPTKSEPDYTEEAGEVETAEQETTYVEDDSYGDMKYDESYFTENDESGATAGGAGAATTSTAVVKQSFVDNSYVEQADQSASEAQGKTSKKRILSGKFKATPGKGLKKRRIPKDPLKVTFARNDIILGMSLLEEVSHKKPIPLSSCANFTAPENVIKTSSNNHTLMVIKKARLKGICVQCIKNANAGIKGIILTKIVTYCPQCPGGDWICESCFDETHTD